MITSEQVADLQPGDVVELSWAHDGDPEVDVTVRGPLHTLGIRGALFLADYCVRDSSGSPVYVTRRFLTVIARAPKPFYVNHPRTEPALGDVVTITEDSPMDGWRPTWAWSGKGGWISTRTGTPISGSMIHHPLLLIDGETGQVVP